MVTTGPSAFRRDTFKTGRKNTGRMSVVRPWQGVSGPDTKYDVWVLDNHPLTELLTYNKLDIGSLRYDISHYIIDGPGSLSGFGNILGVFGDLWPAPGTG